MGLDIVSALTCTSIFACLLALHNILARYVYALGSDGVLPKWLASVHRVHGSPHKASVVVSIVGLCAVTALIGSAAAPYEVYAASVGIAGYALLVLQILTSLAVIVFFRRKHSTVGRWRSVVAPTASLAGLLVTWWLATAHMEAMTGDLRIALILLASVFLALVIGIAYAVRLRRIAPEVYLAIGRQSSH